MNHRHSRSGHLSRSQHILNAGHVCVAIALMALPAMLNTGVNSVWAATYYWDTNGATAGQGGTGIWSTSDANWNLDPDGDGGAAAVWPSPNNHKAVFQAAGPLAPGVVTVSGSVGVDDIFFNTSGYTIAGGTLTLVATGGGNTPTIVVAEGHSATIDASLDSAQTVTKAGLGTLVYSGSNVYSGVTILSGGTLVLDYSSSDTSKLSDTAGLSLGGEGGTLELKGGTHVEVVSNTGVTAGGVTRVRRNSVDPGSSVLQLGELTRSVGGAVDFAEDGLATTTTANVNGILAGNLTTGTGGAAFTVNGRTWARSADGTTPLATPALITGLPDNQYALNSFTTDANVDVSSDQAPTTFAGTSQINSLRFNAPVDDADDKLTLTLTGVNEIRTGGILVTPDVGSMPIEITGGSLRPGVNNIDLIVHQYNTESTLTISSVLPGRSSGRFTKTGPGTVVLNATNTYTQATRIIGGVLAVIDLQDGGVASSIGSVSNGVAGLLINDATLRYIGNGGVGQGNSTDRLFTIGVYGATIDASGSAPLSFTNSGNLGGGGGRTLTLTGTNTQDNTFAPVLTSTASLTKTGVGKWILTGAQTYTGPTTINNGILAVNGSLAAGSAVSVNANGTLAGNGAIAGHVIVHAGATLAPGNSPGSIELGALDLQAGSTLAIELAGTVFVFNDTETYDRVKVFGNTTLAGLLNVSLLNGFALGDNQVFGIVDAGGGLTGAFSNFAEGDTVLTSNGFDLKITYLGNVTDSGVSTTGGWDIVLYTQAAQAIPEPATSLLLLSSLTLVGGRCRRARSSAGQ